MIKHPAKFSDPILEKIKNLLPDRGAKILDPFAGTGKLKTITGDNDLYLNEIEYEWAVQGLPERCIVGNALVLPFREEVFDFVITSPCYGNRMADSHNAKDKSKRITYTHMLGRELHNQNSGKMQWGTAYREFHKYAWIECDRVLKKNGTMILNISNHIRKGTEQFVQEWHFDILKKLGYWCSLEIHVDTPRSKYGSNSNLRVEYETIFVMEKQ